jgi:hypothetical protein
MFCLLTLKLKIRYNSENKENAVLFKIIKEIYVLALVLR